MKLTPRELAYVRSKGLYITEKCAGCGKLLNQTVRYTIIGKPEVYCSAECRDFAFLGDRREVKKRATPKRCVRAEKARLAGKVAETVTATQQTQQFAEAKIGGQGNPPCQRLPMRNSGS